MGKRGPKPADLGLLTVWEFEFYKAFHLLRDGTQLPARHAPPVGLTSEELRAFIGQLRDMSPERYWLTSRLVAAELGEGVNLKKPPTQMDRWWAERERNEEIYWLERELKPPSIAAQAGRRKIWDDLVRANTYAALRKACGRWAQLPDVRAAGMTPFPKHVLQNVAQFIFMKRNKRFPRSNYGDDARIEYLARGMAGVRVGIRAMTGIERLRNLKHGPGGPFWDERDHHCTCWRCSLRGSQEVQKITAMAYENGLRLFMKLAATTKVPREWNAVRPKPISKKF